MNNNNNLLRKILLICKEVTNHEEFNNELTISVKPQKLLSLFDNLKKINLDIGIKNIFNNIKGICFLNDDNKYHPYKGSNCHRVKKHIFNFLHCLPPT